MYNRRNRQLYADTFSTCSHDDDLEGRGLDAMIMSLL